MNKDKAVCMKCRHITGTWGDGIMAKCVIVMKENKEIRNNGKFRETFNYVSGKIDRFSNASLKKEDCYLLNADGNCKNYEFYENFLYRFISFLKGLF